MPRALTHEPEERMTREDYRAWASQQPSHRFERIEGVVVAMAPERAAHNRRKGSARDALRRRGATCRAAMPGIHRRHDDRGRRQRLRTRRRGALRRRPAARRCDGRPGSAGNRRGSVAQHQRRRSRPEAARLFSRSVAPALLDCLARDAAHRPPLAHARRRYRNQSLYVWPRLSLDPPGLTPASSRIFTLTEAASARGFRASRRRQARHRRSAALAVSRIGQDGRRRHKARQPRRLLLVHHNRPP